MSESQASKYAIERVIGKGGMAEVFKARMTLVEGIERVVALKRVHLSLSFDPHFLSMFLDEARLSMLLTHGNIVQVFDVGNGPLGYFLVMEYVDGIHLGEVLDRAHAVSLPLPIRIAAFIIGEVCKALAYAHACAGPDGRPLGVIHRDVSPTNVLLSRDGEVKLADFGLAKASSQTARTAPGVVKGKVGYFAPESLEGVVVDARADLFAAGVLLWELCSGRRLFVGGTDLEVLLKVRGAEVPSLRAFNTDIDAAFEAIVMRALARDREARYQTARALGEALAAYCVGRGFTVTSWDIADIVRNHHRPGAL